MTGQRELNAVYLICGRGAGLVEAGPGADADAVVAASSASSGFDPDDLAHIAAHARPYRPRRRAGELLAARFPRATVVGARSRRPASGGPDPAARQHGAHLRRGADAAVLWRHAPCPADRLRVVVDGDRSTSGTGDSTSSTRPGMPRTTSPCTRAPAVRCSPARPSARTCRGPIATAPRCRPRRPTSRARSTASVACVNDDPAPCSRRDSGSIPTRRRASTAAATDLSWSAAVREALGGRPRRRGRRAGVALARPGPRGVRTGLGLPVRSGSL